MKVYIVTKGEYCEGASPRSVHATREGAIKAALERNKACFAAWAQQDASRLEWVSGCDILSVEEWEVEP